MSDHATMNLNASELSALVKALEHIGVNRNYQEYFHVYNDTHLAGTANKLYKRLKSLASRKSRSVSKTDTLRKSEKDLQEELRQRFINTNQENKVLKDTMCRASKHVEDVLKLVTHNPDEAITKLKEVHFELGNYE